jgi:hypothetical protein
MLSSSTQNGIEPKFCVANENECRFFLQFAQKKKEISCRSLSVKAFLFWHKACMTDLGFRMAQAITPKTSEQALWPIQPSQE